MNRRVWGWEKRVEGGHLTRQHRVLVDQPELHRPGLQCQQVRGVGGSTQILQLGELLKPTHRLLPHEVGFSITSTAHKTSVSGPCGAVEITINAEGGAILVCPLQVQHHPHLAPCEGRAGVLLASALVQALALVGLLAPAPLVVLAV